MSSPPYPTLKVPGRIRNDWHIGTFIYPTHTHTQRTRQDAHTSGTLPLMTHYTADKIPLADNVTSPQKRSTKCVWWGGRGWGRGASEHKLLVFQTCQHVILDRRREEDECFPPPEERLSPSSLLHAIHDTLVSICLTQSPATKFLHSRSTITHLLESKYNKARPRASAQPAFQKSKKKLGRLCNI